MITPRAWLGTTRRQAGGAELRSQATFETFWESTLSVGNLHRHKTVGLRTVRADGAAAAWGPLGHVQVAPDAQVWQNRLQKWMVRRSPDLRGWG